VVVTCGETDMMKSIVTFRNFVNMSKNNLKIASELA